MEAKDRHFWEDVVPFRYLEDKGLILRFHFWVYIIQATCFFHCSHCEDIAFRDLWSICYRWMKQLGNPSSGLRLPPELNRGNLDMCQGRPTPIISI